MPRRPYVVSCALALSLAAPALAQRDISGRVKDAATQPFTSWLVETTNPNTTPSEPLGWTRTQIGPRVWRFTGGTTNPGGTFTTTLTNPNTTNPGGQVTGGDYLVNGNPVWVKVCSDPVGMRAVSGGATGTTYLGYEIPAGQWGYFYQMYNQANYGGITAKLEITLQPGTTISNLQVLDNHFAFLPTAGFDLDDMALPDISRMDDLYEVQQYMEPGDALGPGGTVPATWTLSGQTLTMDFLAAEGAGMGAAASGPICAFLSPFSPGISDFVNANVTFVNNFQCPEDYAMIPIVPTPGSLGLLACCAFLLLGRRGRA
jgi:hypothetical protein